MIHEFLLILDIFEIGFFDHFPNVFQLKYSDFSSPKDCAWYKWNVDINAHITTKKIPASISNDAVLSSNRLYWLKELKTFMVECQDYSYKTKWVGKRRFL